MIEFAVIKQDNVLEFSKVYNLLLLSGLTPERGSIGTYTNRNNKYSKFILLPKKLENFYNIW